MVSMSELRPIAHCRYLWIGLVLLACPAWCRLEAQSAPAAAAVPPRLAATAPVHLTAEEDHQRLLDLLGIKELRRGVDTNAQSPHAANYDEAKANVHPNRPDPLVLKNGKRVTSARTWWSKRRPEIVEDLDREILGRAPAGLPKVSWEVVSTTAETIGDVPVVTKRLTGHVDNSAYPEIEVKIDLILTTPAKASGPVPVILYLAFSREFSAANANLTQEMSMWRGDDLGIPWQQQVLARGWGFAILNPVSYQADDGAGLTEGMIGLMNKGQPRKLDDWGVLRAWAWGADRAMDYFETDKAVDAKRVGIQGHSRYGKATVVSMAYDPRIAIAFVSSSGEGGAKLHRRNWGELIENVAAVNEYHWMAGNFLKYAGPLKWSDLPVDSHELVAMCAPRPVFLSAGNSIDPAVDLGNSDAWVDAKGTFLAGVGAGPVYRLLGKKDLGTAVFPPIETGLLDGDIIFRQHSSGHTPNPNWPVFIAFADREFNSSSSR